MAWVTEEKADACHVDLRNDPEIDLEMDGEQREEMLALLRGIPRHTSEGFAYEVTPRAVNKSRDRFRNLMQLHLLKDLTVFPSPH